MQNNNLKHYRILCSYTSCFSFPRIPPRFHSAAVQRRRSLNFRSKNGRFEPEKNWGTDFQGVITYLLTY